MKLIKFGVMALCALALVGCGKKGAKDFKEVKLGKEATAADSVSYFLGEQIASNRFMLQQQDTAFKSKKAIEKFDEGFYAGLKAMTGDDEAFNQGYAMGVMAANQLYLMGKEYGEKFSVDGMASGYASAFDKSGNKMAKFDENVVKHQGVMMSLMQNYQAKAQLKQVEEALKKTAGAKKKLPAEAKKNGYAAVNGFYVKTAAKGNGTKLTKGQAITANLGLNDVKGNAIFPVQSVQQTVGDNSSYSPAIEGVISTFEMGGHYYILGTVDQLFNKDMAAQAIMSGQMNPDQLYVIDYTVAPAAEIKPVAAPQQQ